MISFIETQRALATIIVFVATFFATLTIGQLLKRRAGVRFGLLFQLFCLALAFYGAISVYGIHSSWRNHVGALLALLSTGVVLALLDRYLWEGYFVRRRQSPIP